MNENLKENLLIIGASGHGKVVADIALKMKKWKKIAFLDDDDTLKSSLGLDVIGKSRDSEDFIAEWDIFVAVGNNSTREKIQLSLKTFGATIPVLIHPNAVIGEEVEIASGTVVMAGVIINSSTKIGEGCIINTAATVDHDNLIEDYVHVSPGVNLAGSVKVALGSWLGIGSVAIQGVKIGGNTVVGAGAVVVNELPANCVAVGAPAKPIKFIY
ncbi:acetyltransferase [Planococcus sp. SE5232]|uniref:acetyltransferase n=1 Tax=unclassified Planococcus (in: firmicutes) TaxID=2662419 RepID=UPI003D6AE1D2